MRKIYFILSFVFLFSLLYSRPYLYVAHKENKKLTIIDTAGNDILKEIKLKFLVNDILLDYNNKYLYLSSPDTNSVYRLKTRSLTIDNDFVTVGSKPCTMAISFDDKKLYVANKLSKDVVIIDLPSFEVNSDPIPLPAKPVDIILSKTSSRAYVALSGRKGIAVLDLKKRKYIGAVKAGVDPWEMCIYKNKLYISNEGLGSITVVNLKTYKIDNEIITSDLPKGITAFNDLLYVAVLNGVDVFETYRYEKPASLGIDYEGYDCVYGKTYTGKKVFVTGYSKEEKKGTVYVVDPEENEITKEINLKGSPFKLEIKKEKPTPTPTFTNTYTKTFTPTSTYTPTNTYTFTPTVTPTKKIVKKKIKKRIVKKKKKKWVTSTLTGRVYVGRRPGQNIRVSAMNKHTKKIYKTRTDYKGYFVFEDLPIGAYVVSIDETYLKETAVGVVVVEGKNKLLVIHTKKR